MLVIVHDDHAVGGRGNRRVIKLLILGRHAYIELHPLRMQVRGEFVQQCDVTRLSGRRERFKVHHQSAKAIGTKESCHLLAENRARVRIIQKTGDVRNPVGAVEVIHHREDFHAAVFRFQQRHDAVIHGARVIVLHHIEKLVGLVIHALQSAIWSEDMQPIRIQ